MPATAERPSKRAATSPAGAMGGGDRGRSESNALHVDYTGKLQTYGKGFGAVVDAAHLARCDFMMHSNSAVSEFSHWLAGPRLHKNAYNMNFDLQTQLQNGHSAVFGSGINGVAAGYAPPKCPGYGDPLPLTTE